MPKLKCLSGADITNILGQFGFVSIGQRGSHVKLRRVLPDGSRQTLTIPMHRELDTGTLGVIFRQASQYVPADDLRPHFYS
ncbi:MAG TPA: type II toxin-antitoxin system HicA family toxin [Candidatus Binataceae bacterium]|nr:type II toxin-antitoxin system HicA family toxin [Candidatus Binataceae bacterium]